MNALTPFAFGDHLVRTIIRDGEPWFVAADVCRVLEHTNPTMAISKLDEDERDTLNNADGIAAPQVQQLNIINESGLYALILTSRKPQAKAFRKWVTADLLPTLRKTGHYSVVPDVPAEPDASPDSRTGQDHPASGNMEACHWITLLTFVRSTQGRAAAVRLYRSSPLPQVPDLVVRTPALDPSDTDARQAFAHLLTLTVPNQSDSLQQLIRQGRDGHIMVTRALASVGIKVQVPNVPDAIGIGLNHPAIDRHFKPTQWGNGLWRNCLNALSDLDARPTVDLSGLKSRVTLLPVSLFAGEPS